MRLHVPLVLAFGLTVAGAACSSFSEEESEGVDDGGLPETSTGGEDASVTDTSVPDASDAADAADVFPSTPLVPVTGAARPFSIEATEVSVAQYFLFKRRFPAPTSYPADRCPQKTALGPPAKCTARFANDDPMTCVDWCDANAYCKAIGRHLCGDLADGGPLSMGNQNQPGSDEWFYACRGPSALTYPYGNTSMSGNCATELTAPTPVGTMPLCEGAANGLFDMSGNAGEWIDACVPGVCAVRGGTYSYRASDATCAVLIGADPQSTNPEYGFRCCAEP